MLHILRVYSTGSYVAEPCPLGTYSNVSGAVNNYECFDCDAGYYCSSVAGGAPTGACWGGYYCTGAAKTPIQHITDPGKYTTASVKFQYKQRTVQVMLILS